MAFVYYANILTDGNQVTTLLCELCESRIELLGHVSKIVIECRDKVFDAGNFWTCLLWLNQTALGL
jgi:hypothetical protein